MWLALNCKALPPYENAHHADLRLWTSCSACFRILLEKAEHCITGGADVHAKKAAKSMIQFSCLVTKQCCIEVVRSLAQHCDKDVCLGIVMLSMLVSKPANGGQRDIEPGVTVESMVAETIASAGNSMKYKSDCSYWQTEDRRTGLDYAQANQVPFERAAAATLASSGKHALTPETTLSVRSKTL